MKRSILIAEPCDILRTGLSTIFTSDERVTSLYEASTAKDLKMYLSGGTIDLIIVNKILVPDITILPPKHFILLTAKFDITTFLQAYKQGAQGYLLENTQAELFRAALCLPQGTFLIEPSHTNYLVEYIINDTRLFLKEELLTPREREIVQLLREGIDRNTIARQLNISSATLKTHIKNIFRKRVNVVMP